MQTAGTDFWTIATAIGTWLAAIATFTAAIVALFAMNSWRKQEQAKAFKNVMMGLRAFLFELEGFPENFSDIDTHIHGSSDVYRDNAIKRYTPCREAWGGYRVFSRNKDIENAWNDVDRHMTGYIYRARNKRINEAIKLVNELEQQYDLANKGRIEKWYEKAAAARICE